MPDALAALTTLRLGGPAGELVEVHDEQELVAAVASGDAAGRPPLVVAGGSNLVVGDDGVPGRVVLVRTRGIVVETRDGGGGNRGNAVVRVAAGESWEALVLRAVREGWVGIETLAGIPGSVGATPVQNVGAYGQDVAQTIAWVRAWDRAERRQLTLDNADCGFGYRTSRFKAEPGRFLVLEVCFELAFGDLSAPVAYAELARRLGCELAERRPLAEVRDAVLALRSAKGMVLDSADHDTWSVGSFFTNPVLTAETAATLPGHAPRWPQSDGQVKVSAAWLIRQAGFEPGHGTGPARISTKHTLALTNQGGAATDDLLALAREVQGGVRARFGVTLHPEPVLVGCSL
ncbi:MAG: UDP-N-acetylmuramate dehydrogenase [Nocardioidaceae bacterium]|nr:UDP-N-acetylmuramate dehydrogenase [Nocardioidaceae bacterium]